MKVYIKKEKGITLVALVITIIILLILAGIAIVALSGENGILTRASEAKQKTGRQEIIEKAKLEILEEQTEKQRDITDEEAKAIIAKYDKDCNEENINEFIFKEKDKKEYIETENGYEIFVKEIWDDGKINFMLNGVQYSCKKGETFISLFEQRDII